VGPWAGAAVAAGLVVWSLGGTGADPLALLGPEGLGQMATYARKLFPPDLSAVTLHETGAGALETFAISLVGTCLAVAIALPLAFLATRTVLSTGILYAREDLGWRRHPRIGVYLGAKMMLNVLRTIPEIVWALIFVFAVGLGPFPGALALGCHTGGVLGKLFGEVLEDVDPHPLETLQAGAAGRAAILFYGVLPQAWPQFLAYALYRWEVKHPSRGRARLRGRRRAGAAHPHRDQLVPRAPAPHAYPRHLPDGHARGRPLRVSPTPRRLAADRLRVQYEDPGRRLTCRERCGC
jgi:ABC-type phosphate/phosphonate transport system permease subunit